MTRPIVLLARTGLRFVAGLMFMAALAAITATVVLRMASGGQPEWAPVIIGFAVAMAAAFGLGAIGHAAVMPAVATITRQDSAGKDGSLPPYFVLFVAALVGLAVLQVPRVVVWWGSNLGLLDQLMGGESDPLGLSLVPAAVLVSTPAVAGLATIAYALTGAMVLAGPMSLASRVLGACVLLQGGLIAGLDMLERALGDLGRAFQRLVETAADPLASAQVADWLTRYELNRGPVGWRLKWILAGYVVAFFLSLAIARRSGASDDVSERVDDPVEPVPPRPLPGASMAPTRSPFNDSLYSIAGRPSVAGTFLGKPSVYDIASIPPKSSERFALSWTRNTGVLSRQPSGEEIYRIDAHRSLGLSGRRVYEVIDASTGASIGTLTKIGSDWDVRDISGETAVRVLRFDAGPARARYVAKWGDQDIWWFVWGLAGVTGASAEMQVEFLDADDRINRALAIALAVVLENQARRVSRWGAG